MMTTPVGVALVSDSAHALHTDTWQIVGGAWTRLAGDQNLTPRIHAAMAYDPVRDQIVVHGGISDLFSGFLRDDTWTFAGTWQLRQPTTSAPFSWHAAMTFDRARSEALLFGGGGSVGLLAETWVWNGQTWAQRVPATAPPAR